MTSIKGRVSDAGGGYVTVFVDRDTESYPSLGAEVIVSSIQNLESRFPSREMTIREIFKKFGWELDDEFLERYMTDAWIYNLVNALVNLHLRYEDMIKEANAKESRT